jgi:ATP-binding cassette, subfamily F, member 3
LERLDYEVTLLSFAKIGVDFGATKIFDDVTFTVAAGQRWGIVGRNGTGKTTLFRLLTGEVEPTRGELARPPGLRVSLLEQHREFGGASTVWEAAAGPYAELLALERALAERAEGLGDAGEGALTAYGHDLERFEREGGYTIAPRVDAVLHGLGFDPAAARTTPISQLSGGERGRLGLVRQLVAPADVLLLDEPTNHLDLETTSWLESYLAGVRTTVLLISHDRAFLSAVADHVLHFEAGTATPYDAGYASFVEQRTLRRTTAQRQFAQQQRKIASEEDYIARNIAGQNSRQAKGRRTRLARMARLSPPPTDEGSMSLRFAPTARGGDRVVIADRATVRVGDRVLVADATGTLIRGDVLALVGPNGSGKTTLLRTLLGDRDAAAGDLRIGSGITVGYYRQDLAQVPLDTTVYDVINDLRPMWDRRLIQGHLGRFGFSGDEVARRTETLSGGERARVALAMLMLSGANLLVLDEPTNHLDVESIEALEDAIGDYDGSVLLVSHDRELLRSLSTRVWILHERRITTFDAGFAEWEVVSAERARAAAVVAAEEERVRRVEEQKKTHRRDEASRSARAVVRSAQRRVAEIEAGIQALEERVADITRQLEDPSLYVAADGAARANALGKELDDVKRSLDLSLDAWAVATERADTLGDGAS